MRKIDIMTPKQADTWRDVVHAERLELYAPETKTTPGRTRVRKMDEPDEPADLHEDWRKTFEFGGNEALLVEGC